MHRKYTSKVTSTALGALVGLYIGHKINKYFESRITQTNEAFKDRITQASIEVEKNIITAKLNTQEISGSFKEDINQALSQASFRFLIAGLMSFSLYILWGIHESSGFNHFTVFQTCSSVISVIGILLVLIELSWPEIFNKKLKISRKVKRGILILALLMTGNLIHERFIAGNIEPSIQFPTFISALESDLKVHPIGDGSSSVRKSADTEINSLGAVVIILGLFFSLLWLLKNRTGIFVTVYVCAGLIGGILVLGSILYGLIQMVGIMFV